MSEWQPIKTAPRDGTRVLVYTQVGNPSTFEGVHVAEWAFVENDEDRWLIPSENGWLINPSHWMPLPKPPNPSA